MSHIEPVRNDALVVSSISILAKYNFVGRELLDAVRSQGATGDPAFLLNHQCCNACFHRFGIVP